MMRKTKSTLKQCAALVSMLSVLAFALWLFVFLRTDEKDTKKQLNFELASDSSEYLAVDISTMEWDYTGGFIYDGAIHTVSLVGIPVGIEIIYSGNSSSEAGYYVADYEIVYDKDRVILTGVAPSPLEWKISPAATDISGISIPDKTVVHDGEEHTLDIIGDIPGGVDISSPLAESEVGEYEMAVEFSLDENYIPISPMVRKLVILDPAVLIESAVESTGDKYLAYAGIEALGALIFLVNVAAIFLLVTLAVLLIFSLAEAHRDSDIPSAGEGDMPERNASDVSDIQPLNVCSGSEPTYVPPPSLSDESGENIMIGDRCVYIRYRSSFTSRLIRAGEQTQEKYGEIKNFILSYKGVKSRISWNHEIFTKGKQLLSKINIKGKTLTIYLSLDPKDFNENKYHHTDLSDNAKHEKVPFMMKVKSARSVKYSKELVALLMSDRKIDKGESVNIDYRLPYEDNLSLAKRGIVKIILPPGVKLDRDTDIRKADIAIHIKGEEQSKKETDAPLIDAELLDELEYIK